MKTLTLICAFLALACGPKPQPPPIDAETFDENVQDVSKTSSLDVDQGDEATAGLKWHGRFYLVARGPDGVEKWREDITNAVTYAGQQKVLKCFFTATACPTATAQYVGLATATPSQTTTLSTVTELSGTGYQREQVSTWTCSSNASSNNNCATTQETWTAGSDWAAVTSCFISDASTGTSGTLLSYAAFSQSRDLASGDSLNVTYTLTLQGFSGLPALVLLLLILATSAAMRRNARGRRPQ